MSTSEIDSILTRVERLSTDDKKLLIKRVVDLLGEPARRPKTQRTLPVNRRRKTSVPSSQQRAALDEEIFAYAQRHGGGPEISTWILLLKPPRWNTCLMPTRVTAD